MHAAKSLPAFKTVLTRLKREYGVAQLPSAKGPFELVLWENACYLLPDERRSEVFEGLRSQAGLTPQAIWDASDEVLLPLAKRGGMRPEVRVMRWREIASIVLNQFGGNLDSILALPPAKARKALKLFPCVGDPVADKILLFCGVNSGLPLESNGLRVLTRIGYGNELKDYGATYRSVQGDLSDPEIAGPLPKQVEALAEAHLLLREHGKTLCKLQNPQCNLCPVADLCAYPGKDAARLAR